VVLTQFHQLTNATTDFDARSGVARWLSRVFSDFVSAHLRLVGRASQTSIKFLGELQITVAAVLDTLAHPDVGKDIFRRPGAAGRWGLTEERVVIGRPIGICDCTLAFCNQMGEKEVIISAYW
jgi:hypothetical protein